MNSDALHPCADQYLVPPVLRQLKKFLGERPARLMDIGCGDGYAASCYAEAGYSAVGFDVSADDVSQARARYPHLRFEVASVYDADLFERLSAPVDAVVALEVVEHLVQPKKLFEQSRRLLKDGGILILSTPYHGYGKNLALSLLGSWDQHHSVSWDGGHIKFFSKRSLAAMAREAGFRNLRLFGVGRIPYFWKSMVLVAEK